MDDKIKALTDNLVKHIEKASKVFITGHDNPDYDAIGSALGIGTLVDSLGKDAYIIVNDISSKLDFGVQRILASNKNDILRFVNY